jgi:hypothetical protein
MWKKLPSRKKSFIEMVEEKNNRPLIPKEKLFFSFLDFCFPSLSFKNM